MSTLPQGASGLPSLGGELSSLAQEARKKQLRVASGIFIAVGILTILANAVLLAMFDSQVDTLLSAELAKQGLRLEDTDPGAHEKARATVARTGYLIFGGAIAIGVVYLVLAALVSRKPVVMTVTGLVLYIASMAIFGLLDPTTLLRGLIIKLLIILVMAKAVSAALAYERAGKSVTA
ncbi:MAG: hypothetical protein CHACPFDD_00140 [Phycisphaerae bacterium]|nr:hypothetical protein [Phycisphaerae bacterium]